MGPDKQLGLTVYSFILHRLKDVLKTRLRECGWRDQVKEHCKGSLTEHGIYLMVPIQVYKCTNFCIFILLVF